MINDKRGNGKWTVKGRLLKLAAEIRQGHRISTTADSKAYYQRLAMNSYSRGEFLIKKDQLK